MAATNGAMHSQLCVVEATQKQGKNLSQTYLILLKRILFNPSFKHYNENEPLFSRYAICRDFEFVNGRL